MQTWAELHQVYRLLMLAGHFNTVMDMKLKQRDPEAERRNEAASITTLGEKCCKKHPIRESEITPYLLQRASHLLSLLNPVSEF